MVRDKSIGVEMEEIIELDGYYYWTMGDLIDETTILNRCLVEDYEVRDGAMFYRRSRL